MLKCPFCHYDNEDGALFCEQCKSDLAGVALAPAVAAAEVVSAQVVEAMPVNQPGDVPIAAVVEATPVVAEAAEAAVVAVAEVAPVEATPIETTPIESTPIESTPIEATPIEATPIEATPIEGEAAPAEAPPMPPPTPSEVGAPPIAEAPAAPAAGQAIPAGAQVRLLVLRGLKRNVEYPVYEGVNFIGRADEKPVDIDLEDQEPPDRIWSSRQHAVISLEDGQLNVEDLNSSNGTFVNRQRIYPGQKQPLSVNDVIQIGTVQLKVIV